MEQSEITFAVLLLQAKRLAKQLLTIGGNRFELGMVERQEEREHLTGLITLGVGVAVFGLLAGIALSGCIVVLLWDYSPLVAFLALSASYSLVTWMLYRRLAAIHREWKPLDSTF